jgi:hypothetical protein
MLFLLLFHTHYMFRPLRAIFGNWYDGLDKWDGLGNKTLAEFRLKSDKAERDMGAVKRKSKAFPVTGLGGL